MRFRVNEEFADALNEYMHDKLPPGTGPSARLRAKVEFLINAVGELYRQRTDMTWQHANTMETIVSTMMYKAELASCGEVDPDPYAKPFAQAVKESCEELMGHIVAIKEG